MKRAAHFFDHPDVDPEERDTVLRPRPSHVTKAQAARILGVTRSATEAALKYSWNQGVQYDYPGTEQDWITRGIAALLGRGSERTTAATECDVCGGGGICFRSDGSRPNCPVCHPASPALAEAAREVLAYRETAKEASRVHIEMHNQIIALQAEVARMRNDLLAYGHHLESCKMLCIAKTDGWKIAKLHGCSCGFDTAKEK